MPITFAELVAKVGIDRKEFDSEMKNVDKATDQTGKKFSGFGKAAGVAATGGLLVLAGAAKVGFDELKQGQRVSAQTEAVIKSTGGSAKVTADHVDDLATSIMKKSGMDDEAVKSGENMLLTFTNIRNETGQGNKIFDSATNILADMSTAMGTDMNKSAIQLGKALNDPIKGVTALTKVGVTFTESQKETIKKLVETGHTADAQKVILKELNKEFGGSAEAAGKTLPGQLNIAKESFSNLAGSLIESLLPAFTQFATVAQNAASFLAEHQTLAKVLIGILGGLAVGILAVNAAVKVWAASTTVMTAAQWLLNAAMEANPLVLVATLLVGLGAALVIAYKKSETFRAIVNAAFEGVRKGIDFLKDHWLIALTVMTGGIGLAAGLIIKNWDKISGAATEAWNIIRAAVNGAGGVAEAGIRAIGRAIDTVQNLLIWVRDHGGAAITTFSNVTKKPLDALFDGFNDVRIAVNKIVDLFQWIISHAKDIAGKFGFIGDAIGKVGGLLGKIPGVGDVAAGFNAAAAAQKRGGGGGGAGSGGLTPFTSHELAAIRSAYPVTMTSGFRTAAENARVGGAPNSDHLTGRAIDLVPSAGWNSNTIAMMDRLAGWASAQSFVRWVGWRGVPGHGPYDHLHLSFKAAMGGVVPGPIGSPVPILAHGGEEILPNLPGGRLTSRTLELHVHYHGTVIQEREAVKVLREGIVDDLRRDAGALTRR